MSKEKKDIRRGMSRHERHHNFKRLGQRKIAAAIGLLLVLSLGSAIIAQWKTMHVATKTRAMLKPAPVTAPSPSPLNLSKEYIYADDKLVATEEPGPALPLNASIFISQTVPSVMNAGQVYSVTVRMKNTGSNTWAATTQHRLGSQNAQDNGTWGLGRVELSAPVATGAEVSFTFNVNAPATAGTYNFQWKMVQDGVGWFGDVSPNVAVIVNANLPPAVSLILPAGAATFQAPANISLSATAADSDGTVSKVEFFQGATKLGEDTTSPYTFSWSNVAIGNYTLTAKATDNLNSVTTSTPVSVTVYNSIENVVWTNVAYVSASGNNLTKSGAASAWDAGAVSTREIISGDGYVEFAVGETNNHKMCGLSNGDSGQGYEDIDFAIYPNYTGNFYIYEGGISRGSFGTYVAGDRLRVSVEGGVVKYRKNGVLLYTSTVAPVYPLRADTTLWSPGATISNVTVGGTLQTALPMENVAWTNIANVTAPNNNLTKSGAASAWDAGAASIRGIAAGDGYVEFAVGETNNHKMCGLSNGDSGQGYEDIDFAIYPNYTGNFYIYEGGISRGSFGTYVAGDRLRVSVEGGVVKYRKNGVLLYTSTVAPVYPLRVDTSLWSPGATVKSVVLAGSNLQNAAPTTVSVTWTNAVNVTTSSNNLTRSSATNVWDGGASSTNAIASGDGYVEFTVSAGSSYKMCGLSHSNDADQNYAEIDFALFPSADGTLNVYENANWRGALTTYAAGDVFRVAIEGGAVKYRKNGVLIYTSAITPNYPLHVDTSLYTPNSTISNVVISGILTP